MSIFNNIKTYFYRKELRKRETYIHSSAIVVNKKNFYVGSYAYIGSDSFINAEGGVTIKDGSVISSKVTILSSSHEFKSYKSLPYDRDYKLDQVVIEEGAWIGYGALILPGIAIGKGAIIGANSVITKNVKEFTIVAGNPAELISERCKEKCEYLIKNKLYLNKVHLRNW
jgi:acetyltransferase-like isoleucine patch superfamily enzyme